MQARAKATSVNITADQLTPENIAKFQQAQGQLSGSLSRLLAVVEHYPELKATQNFQQLQGQLEGIENDIRNSRKNFNDAINTYNTKVRSFPMNFLVECLVSKPKKDSKPMKALKKLQKFNSNQPFNANKRKTSYIVGGILACFIIYAIIIYNSLSKKRGKNKTAMVGSAEYLPAKTGS